MKKADTALYGIQVALAQVTRPIDYLVRRRIQDYPRLNTSEDPEVMFERTMRALLSNVAATENLHSSSKQIKKPLMDQEALDSLIAKKPAAKRQRVHAFRKRQQSSNNKNSISRNTATAQSTNSATTAEANPSNRAADSHRDPKQPPSRGTPCYVQIGMVQTNGQPMGSEHSREGIQNPLQEPPLSRSGIEVVRYENSAESRISAGDDLDSGAAPISKGALRVHSKLLQPAVYDPEKDWRPQTSLRPPQAQQKCGGAELQDGDPAVHLPHGLQNRLFDVPRPTGCIHAYYVLGPTIRVITEPVDFHQDSSPCLTMGQVPRNANLSIFGRPNNHGRIQRVVCENNTRYILQAPGAWIQDQRREIVYVPIPIYQYLRMVINTQHMTLKVPTTKIRDLRREASKILNACQTTLRFLCELYWESSSNVNRFPTWPPNALTTPVAQELLPVEIEIMDFDNETDEPSHPKPIILEEPAEIMERPLFLARDPGIGDIHLL
ncbi:hypothetical protein AYI70_g9127 [Smittium culicis]|uniref:Uncharacterized protein n=1 Tax=Smittium culicis TaxID=133412 RepID=A0A1R1XCR2_9FUNG|nr:hypothetical protein AYI70_g9127 [Smittium culicis]